MRAIVTPNYHHDKKYLQSGYVHKELLKLMENNNFINCRVSLVDVMYIQGVNYDEIYEATKNITLIVYT